MKRRTQVIAASLVLLGLFWSGRESTHGLAAFGEHWWCALPLAAIAVGVAALVTTRAA
jgi:hypothetical protein